jgi:hypothetical protein
MSTTKTPLALTLDRRTFLEAVYDGIHTYVDDPRERGSEPRDWAADVPESWAPLLNVAAYMDRFPLGNYYDSRTECGCVIGEARVTLAGANNVHIRSMIATPDEPDDLDLEDGHSPDENAALDRVSVLFGLDVIVQDDLGGSIDSKVCRALDEKYGTTELSIMRNALWESTHAPVVIEIED